MQTFGERAEAIMKHAEEHYEEGGWDVIVECYTEGELVNMMGPGTPGMSGYLSANRSSEEDIETLRTGLVAIWADQQADARNSAF